MVKLFQNQLGYTYYGDWQDRADSINTRGKQSLYDNLDKNEEHVTRLDTAIRYTKKADWKTNRFKQRDVEHAVKEELGGYQVDIKDLMDLIKSQSEYD